MNARHQDRLGTVLFALVSLALVASLVVQAKLRERYQRIDREDRDPSLTNTCSTLVLLDVTDSLGDAQAEAVRVRLGELEEFELQFGEFVGLCSIGQYPDGDVRSWFLRRFPGRELNPLIETPSRRNAQVDSIFTRPFRAALEQALRPSTAELTGLAAAIQEAAELEGFGPEVPRRRFLLISDLLENEAGFSMYRVPLDSTLRMRPLWFHAHQADLRGAEIEVLEIPRPGLSASERSALRSFWTTYFDSCGAASVRFRRLP
jgi:hypothetical protein